jgi:hypothetical protein
VWLPLGTFDVWSTAAQSAIAGDAKRLGVLGAGQVVDERVWSLLAATGGRPRDILSMLVSLQSLQSNLQNPRLGDVTTAFFAVGEKSPLFAQYLLPSILNESFSLFGSDSVLTQFGVDAAFPALLNADLFAAEKADCDDGDAAPDSVPVVSLRYAKSVKDKDVRDTVAQLVEATTFCSLDGSGKDFERAWVLMVFSHLLLQHNVRVGARAKLFWPRPTGGRELDGPERPTATAIDVFVNASRSTRCLNCRCTRACTKLRPSTARSNSSAMRRRHSRFGTTCGCRTCAPVRRSRSAGQWRRATSSGAPRPLSISPR